MEKYIFTVYDSAAHAYLDPFVAPSVDFAIREFKKVVNTEGHQFNLYPSDYTLFLVGSFDPMSGNLKGQNITSLGVAVTFMEQTQIPFPTQETTNAE